MVQKIFTIFAVLIWITVLVIICLLISGRLENHIISEYKFLLVIAFIAYSTFVKKLLFRTINK